MSFALDLFTSQVYNRKTYLGLKTGCISSPIRPDVGVPVMVIVVTVYHGMVVSVNNDC